MTNFSNNMSIKDESNESYVNFSITHRIKRKYVTFKYYTKKLHMN